MPTFPAYAKVLFDGFGENPESAVLRTEMESGPKKQAQVRSRALVVRPMRCLFTSKADYLSFETWFRTDIKRGAVWFDWTDPVSGTVKKAQIVNGKIEAKPTRKDMERWIVSFELETWDG